MFTMYASNLSKVITYLSLYSVRKMIMLKAEEFSLLS